MKNIKKYINNGITINVGDLIKLNDILFLIIKELFILNDDIYISYDDNVGGGLVIEKLDKFLVDKEDFLETLITPNNIKKENNCGCGCNKK